MENKWAASDNTQPETWDVDGYNTHLESDWWELTAMSERYHSSYWEKDGPFV